MCLAVPARVIEILPDGLGRVDIGGIHREVSLDFVPDIQLGDYVILHVGYALKKLDPIEAEETLKIFDLAVSLLGTKERS